MSDGSVPGALRLSKGAWLFAPDDSELLWRVQPLPPKDPAGFFSQHVRARLRLRVIDVRAVDRLSAGPAVAPTTGVPARLRGTLRRAADGVFVEAPAGVVFWLEGAEAAVARIAADEAEVEVEVDVDGGVVCQVLA